MRGERVSRGKRMGRERNPIYATALIVGIAIVITIGVAYWLGGIARSYVSPPVIRPDEPVYRYTIGKKILMPEEIPQSAIYFAGFVNGDTIAFNIGGATTYMTLYLPGIGQKFYLRDTMFELVKYSRSECWIELRKVS